VSTVVLVLARAAASLAAVVLRGLPVGKEQAMTGSPLKPIYYMPMPWSSMRGLHEDIDHRLFLYVLGALGDAPDGMALDLIDEKTGLFDGVNEAAVEVLLSVLYSLGVVRLKDGQTLYPRSCCLDDVEVLPGVAKAILTLVLVCERGIVPTVEVAPTELRTLLAEIETTKHVTLLDVSDLELVRALPTYLKRLCAGEADTWNIESDVADALATLASRYLRAKGVMP
jgi:hypothetical protein